MPLPFNDTVKWEKDLWGAYNIDRSMTPETTEKEEKKRQLKYLGQGNVGIAYDYGDKVVKYTLDSDEAFIAKNLINKNIPCIVKVFDVELVQQKPEIWAITTEKVKTITAMEVNFYTFTSLTDCLYQHGYYERDIHVDNIGRDKSGNIVVIDLGAICV